MGGSGGRRPSARRTRDPHEHDLLRGWDTLQALELARQARHGDALVARRVVVEREASRASVENANENLLRHGRGTGRRDAGERRASTNSGVVLAVVTCGSTTS